MQVVGRAPDETQALHRRLHDLVNLLAMPGAWINREPHTIAEDLADVLINALSLDLVYIFIRNISPIEIVRMPDSANDGGQARRIGALLEPYLNLKGPALPHSVPNPIGSGVLHITTAPIGQDRDYGVVIAGSQRPDFPSETEQLLLSVGASQIAVTLQQLNLLKEAEEILKAQALQQTAVAELGQQALAGLDLPALMDEAVTCVAQTLQVEYCKVLELLPDGQKLLLRAGVGWHKGVVGQATVGAGRDSQAGYTLMVDEPVVVEDIRVETRFNGPALLHEHGVISGLSVIIQGQEQPFGVLGAHTTKRRVFTQDDVHFLQAVANILAAAIERKRVETSLQASNNLLQGIIEGTTDAIFVKDLQGRYLVMNSAGANIISELKQVEAAQRLLAEAGKILASSIDYSTRLANVAQLAVPELADWCAVHIVDEEESYRQVAVAHVDPAKVELARELQRRYPSDVNSNIGPANVIRTGQSELYPEIPEPLLETVARDAEHLRLIRELQMKSAMVTPLVARGRTLGAMTFVSAESGRRYDQNDLALAEELARRAAMAVDNARLYQAEQKARQEAERAADRISGLQAVTAALSEALTPIQVATVIVEKGLPVIGADSSVIVVLNEQGDCLEILHSTGYSAEKIEIWQSFPVTDPNPLAETVRTGEPIFMESTEKLVATYPKFAQQRDPTYNTLAALPLLVEGRAVGGIGLGFKTARTFSERGREFMLALAYQCAQALERAHLYEAERQARTEAEAAQQHLALLAETRERNRLAQELHDNVAQALGYLNLKIAMTSMLLENGELKEVKANLQELKNVISEAYTDVREEIFNLRAKVSVGLGFLEMLDRYIDKYRRFYKLDIHLVKDTDETLFEFPPGVGPQIIRTIQEALINVRKHARVDQATIRLWQEGDHVCITVEDKGQGFDPAKLTTPQSSSFGLQIMRERVRSVGGDFEIESKPGQGTRIILRYSKN